MSLSWGNRVDYAFAAVTALAIGLAVATTPYLATAVTLGAITLYIASRVTDTPSVSALSTIALLGLLPAVPDSLSVITAAFAVSIIWAAVSTRQWKPPVIVPLFVGYAIASGFWGGSSTDEYVRTIVPFGFALTIPIWQGLEARFLHYGLVCAGSVLAFRGLYTAATEAGRITWYSLDFILPQAVIGSIACLALLQSSSFSQSRLGNSLHSRLLLGALLAAQSSAVILSLSRSLILAMVFGFCVVLALQSRTLTVTALLSRRKVLLATGTVLLVAAVILSSAADIGSLTDRFTEREIGSALDFRAVELRSALQLWLDNPVVGAGAGELFLRSAPELSRSYIHNAPVYVLSLFGLIGFTMYSWLFASSIWKGLKRRDWEAGTGVAVLAALVLIGLTSASFRSIQFNVLLAIGVAMAIGPGSVRNAGRRGGHVNHDAPELSKQN